MKKLIILTCIGIISMTATAQKIDKLITEESVQRVIKTLSADAMMGRPAMIPEQMENATAFIEGEFRHIGLTPLKGLTGFRQEFKKERISPAKITVTLNGINQDVKNILLVSEQMDITIHKDLIIKTIEYDSTISNPAQYFFEKAFALTRDTVSSLILIAPQFEANFTEFKSYFNKRFTRNKKSTQVFILGSVNVTSYSVKATQKIETIKMTNVVGMLEGKSKPAETVVFSGHYDHLGIIHPNAAGDSIANGADDDASGTTAVIELARYFKKLKTNNRTLVFVAFTAEEIGGYGSQYFPKQLDADNVVAMFNIEMIGKASRWGQNSAFITGFEKSDFGTILQQNLTGSPFQFKPDPYPEQDLFYRSDNATLAKLGVPAHTISTDQIDSDKLYHSVDDEFESMDIKNITNTLKAIAISARSIVAGKDTPKRIDKALVR